MDFSVFGHFLGTVDRSGRLSLEVGSSPPRRVHNFSDSRPSQTQTHTHTHTALTHGHSYPRHTRTHSHTTLPRSVRTQQAFRPNIPTHVLCRRQLICCVLVSFWYCSHQSFCFSVYRSFNAHQYPACVLHFRLDTTSYDVNVTPDKRTIFLHRERELVELIKVIDEFFWLCVCEVFSTAPKCAHVGVGELSPKWLEGIASHSPSLLQQW